MLGEKYAFLDRKWGEPFGFDNPPSPKAVSSVPQPRKSLFSGEGTQRGPVNRKIRQIHESGFYNYVRAVRHAGFSGLCAAFRDCGRLTVRLGFPNPDTDSGAHESHTTATESSPGRVRHLGVLSPKSGLEPGVFESHASSSVLLFVRDWAFATTNGEHH